jgi:hypothetical protein
VRAGFFESVGAGHANTEVVMQIGRHGHGEWIGLDLYLATLWAPYVPWYGNINTPRSARDTMKHSVYLTFYYWLFIINVT